VEEGYEGPANITGYNATQIKVLKETQAKDKATLYILFRAVGESG